jgi:hypothetical protein
MKRLVLALVILGCGTSGLLALHRSTIRIQLAAARADELLLVETQRLVQIRIQLNSVTERVGELKRQLELAEGIANAARQGNLEEIPSGSAHLSPNQSERLLAELGFNWATSSDYLIVSKDTLRAISLEGMRGAKLGTAAIQVLAITPEERSAIETSTGQLMNEYNAWTQAHAQRVEPSGDVVAKYILPADTDFSLSLSNNFVTGALGTLGPERGNLLLDYAGSWMQDLGMGGTGGANSLTVKRYPSSSEPHYSLELKYSGNVMTTDVSPYQEFPPAFLPLFPNGWPDLAQREGFELPKEFRKQ